MPAKLVWKGKPVKDLTKEEADAAREQIRSRIQAHEARDPNVSDRILERRFMVATGMRKFLSDFNRERGGYNA